MTSATTGGGSFLSILLVIFIILKLIGVITWSWFWILSPILIPIIGILSIFGIGILFLFIFRDKPTNP